MTPSAKSNAIEDVIEMERLENALMGFRNAIGCDVYLEEITGAIYSAGRLIDELTRTLTHLRTLERDARQP